MLFLHCKLIIILSIYVWLTLTLAKVCLHSRFITGIMAGVLVLVWDTYHCLKTIHLAYARDQLWKRKLLKNNNNKYNKNTHLEECTRQSCPVLTHLLQGSASPIFTAAPLQYFSGCFPLAFLEGHCPSSFPVVTSLHLDSITWNPSAPSNRVASPSSTSSQSC